MNTSSTPIACEMDTTHQTPKKSNAHPTDINLSRIKFIQNMEHTIRTPLSGIQGLATVLSIEEKNPEKKDWLNHIANSARDLLIYCNNTLTFFQEDNDIPPTTNKPFNLKKLLSEIIAIEKPASELKKIPLLLEYKNNISDTLYGDAYRLKEILINLVSNAIKFTHQGKIIISAELLSTQKQNVTLNLSVQDTGIGFDPLAHHSGLGLKIIKKFMAELNGEIKLISETGKGTTFACLLSLQI